MAMALACHRWALEGQIFEAYPYSFWELGFSAAEIPYFPLNINNRLVGFLST